LIYCAAGNPRFAQIAIDNGFLYGAQLPSTVYHPVWFADQNWKAPNKERYMASLAQHKPQMASVLDLERPEQVEEVLEWAEEAAQYVETVMIIPKYSGAIRDVPLKIGNKPVRLGYSVPTGHGGTAVPLREFHDWPVHLLGGGPTVQMELYPYLNVVSVDGNLVQKAALNGVVFDGRVWKSMEKYMGYFVEDDMAYIAFDMSCQCIMETWGRVAARY
jgi:hypothetical protein